MFNIPHKIENFKWNFENVAFVFYLISVAATVLGPVVHYVGWSAALVALLYGKVRYGASLAINVPKESKPAFYALLLFSFWCMFPNIVNADSFYVWGRGASVYLELLLGVYFAMRLVIDEPKRGYMLLAIVVLNTVFSVGYIISYYFPFKMPNKSMMNGNSLGEYATLIMPFVMWYAFTYLKKNYFLSFTICVINAIIILIAMSSGSWLTAFVQGLIMIFFIIYKNPKNLLFLAGFVLFFIIAIVLFDSYLDNRLYQNFQVERQQSANIYDLNKFTNCRYDIWRATLFMSKKHLLTGHGRAPYFEDYAKNVENFKQAFNNFIRVEPAQDAHNMYLETLYTGGIPALILHLYAVITSIILAVSAVRGNKQERFFWGVICLVLIAGRLISGIGGDIFEARRDVAVLFWFAVAVTFMLPSFGCPQNETVSAKEH